MQICDKDTEILARYTLEECRVKGIEIGMFIEEGIYIFKGLVIGSKIPKVTK